MNAYPPAPWRLRGFSVQTLRLVDIQRARPLVPAKMRVLQVIPGRTIAVMYCARYEHGSSLMYSELAVAPALVESRGRIGFWISHIYVDDPHSIAGGREIWTLPKQFASFAWHPEGRAVEVTDGSFTLCRTSWGACTPRLPVPLIAPVLVEGARTFWPKGSCRLARCRAEVAADRGSPIAQLDLIRSHHALVAQNLKLSIPPPSGEPSCPR